jgi:hypothetical protein
MRYIRKCFESTTRRSVYRIYPIGDLHVGAKACNEKLLKRWVRKVRDDPDGYWIGMGDYIDAIGPKDPRWGSSSLADWIGIEDLLDVCAAQTERFYTITDPIADKCLALVEGNHERVIRKHYERDIYREIVYHVKQRAGLPADTNLALGYYGWMHLIFRRKIGGAKSSRIVTFNIHHGYTGGRLAGAKALNMQRWLFTHDCDVALMGHSHNCGVQIEATESLNRTGTVLVKRKLGCFTGTFLGGGGDGDTYSEVKGYLPMPTAALYIEIHPLTIDDGPLITAHAAI